MSLCQDSEADRCADTVFGLSVYVKWFPGGLLHFLLRQAVSVGQLLLGPVLPLTDLLLTDLSITYLPLTDPPLTDPLLTDPLLTDLLLTDIPLVDSNWAIQQFYVIGISFASIDIALKFYYITSHVK